LKEKCLDGCCPLEKYPRKRATLNYGSGYFSSEGCVYIVNSSRYE
jgi:hypothetical protein